MNKNMPADKNWRVLVIDDNRSIHDDFRKILSPATAMAAASDATEAAVFGPPTDAVQLTQFEVDSAYQGEEGVLRVKQALEAGLPYALAFVDVRMPPGWDGMETTRKMWELDPNLQVVFCTAYSDYTWGEMFARLGHRDGWLILKKPFDAVEALQLAHALAQKWWLHQQSREQMEELESRVAERTRELQQTNQGVAVQARIAAIFSTAPDDEMFNEVLQVVLGVMRSPLGVFGYLDENGDVVAPTMTPQIWDKCQVPEKRMRFPRETWGDSGWPRAIREKRSVCSNEPSTSVPEGHVGIQRHICVPILLQGEVIGLFQVANKETDYTETDIHTLEAIAGHVAPLLSARLRRERAEQTQARLAAILDATPDFVGFADAKDTHILYINPAGRKMVGAGAEEDMTQFKISVGHPEWTNKLFRDEIIPTAIRDGAWTGECAFLNRDGREIPVTMVFLAHKSPSGEVEGFSTISRDISRRKRAEVALRAFNALQGRLLSPNPIEKKLKLVTEAVVRMVGADFARIWMIKPGDRCEAGCIHAQVAEGPHTCRFRDRCLHLMASSGRYTHTDGRDHSRVPFGCYKIGKVAAGEEPKFLTNDVTADPRVHNHAWAKELGLVSFAGYRLVDADNIPLGVLALFSQRAISAEEDSLLEWIAYATSMVLNSARAEAALRLSEERFRQLAEHSSEVFWFNALNPKRTLYISPAVETIWGLPAERFYQDPHAWLAAIHPDDQARVHVAWEAFAQGQTPRFELEYRVVRPKGSIRWVQDSGTPIRDEAGEIVRLSGVARDITERKRFEAQLFQSQKLETVGRLAGGVAREFNSILTAIIGQSELMLEDLPSGDSLCENATEIRKAAGRAATLTQQLLAYGRKQMLQPEILDLNSVLAGMEATLRHLMGRGTEVRIAPAAGLKAVMADAGQVEQVIMNMAMNAADAMPNGGKLTLETANVTLDQEYVSRFSELQPGEYVMFAITDTGAGMSEEVKARVFEPFFTTKGVGQGTGLGLSTYHGIIKQSGGHISVYSEPGLGTTFKVYLPQVEQQTKIPVQSLDSPGLPRGTETILLVEDDPSLREMAATLLRRLGYTVLAASNGIEALRLKQQRDIGQVDLLFTDVVMPHMSGKELAERVRALYPHTRILFTSAYTENAIMQQGVLMKGVALLQKPFTPSALAHKLREVLDQPNAPQPDTA